MPSDQLYGPGHKVSVSTVAGLKPAEQLKVKTFKGTAVVGILGPSDLRPCGQLKNFDRRWIYEQGRFSQ